MSFNSGHLYLQLERPSGLISVSSASALIGKALDLTRSTWGEADRPGARSTFRSSYLPVFGKNVT